MKKDHSYTVRLQSGLGAIEETRILLNLWQPGMDAPALFQTTLESGHFHAMSATRLRNLISRCFASRYLVSRDYPAYLLKLSAKTLSAKTFFQLLYLFTARANPMLSDFVKQVYWPAVAAGRESLDNEDVRQFVHQANRTGKTNRPWSEGIIKRGASDLTGCCADFGLLESGRKRVRQVLHYTMDQKATLFLAYDLYFAGFGDNAVIAHPDWELFGWNRQDVWETLKQAALTGFFIMQTAEGAARISWKYKTQEEFIHALAG